MKFGMHVDMHDTQKAIEFIELLAANDVRHVKLRIPHGTTRESVDAVMATCTRLDVKVFVSLWTVSQIPMPGEWVHEALSHPAQMIAWTKELVSWLPADQVLAVGLIEGVHMALRPSNTSVYGFRRDHIVSVLRQLSEAIRPQFKVALSTRIEDLEAGFWTAVPADIYDLDMMIYRAQPLKHKPKLDKPVWLSRAGFRGGYVVTAQQKTMLRTMKQFAEGFAELVFLFSHKANKEFHWGRDGEFAYILETCQEKLLRSN